MFIDATISLTSLSGWVVTAHCPPPYPCTTVDGNRQVTSAAVEDLKLLILSKGLTIISSPSIARKSPVHAPLHRQPVHHLESKPLRLRHVRELSDRDEELTEPQPT
jgi:hypothetical protein